MQAKSFKPEEYFVEQEPYYEAIGDEIKVFEAAYKNQLPVLFKRAHWMRQNSFYGSTWAGNSNDHSSRFPVMMI